MNVRLTKQLKLLASATALAALFGSTAARAQEPVGTGAAEASRVPLRKPEIHMVTMSDGVKIAVAVYRPAGEEKAPALFGASPYRFDNDGVPPTGLFLWKETGPIGWYVSQGYAYVRMDVRGAGRSEGRYEFFSAREARDLYEVIEWIAKQPWSTGKVGGIGESYYGHSQLIAATLHPPHLACIAPYDAGDDMYYGVSYQGGIASDFTSVWWNSNVRAINMHPLAGPARAIDYDVPLEVLRHPTYDEWWRERRIFDRFHTIDIPMFSLAAWGKMDLHLPGDLEAFELSGSPHKKLLVMEASLSEINRQFEDPAFHQRVMLPFYDWCLKGKDTGWLARPSVEYRVRGTDRVDTNSQWPPANVRYRAFFLDGARSGAVQSLNDGSLLPAPAVSKETATVFSYPNEGWTLGTVGFGPKGPQPLRRVLTFVTPPLPSDVEMAGDAELVLYASSTQTDTNFIVKLADQSPDSTGQGGSTIVTKGWLRASLRAKDITRSVQGRPVLRYDTLEPLTPGKVYEFEIPLVGMAYHFSKGRRILVEISNGDSPVTDSIFTHAYVPSQVGADSILHDQDHPSRLLLPIVER